MPATRVEFNSLKSRDQLAILRIAWPIHDSTKLKTIAAGLGWSLSTLKRSLRSLKALGFIRHHYEPLESVFGVTEYKHTVQLVVVPGVGNGPVESPPWAEANTCTDDTLSPTTQATPLAAGPGRGGRSRRGRAGRRKR